MLCCYTAIGSLQLEIYSTRVKNRYRFSSQPIKYQHFATVSCTNHKVPFHIWMGRGRLLLAMMLQLPCEWPDSLLISERSTLCIVSKGSSYLKVKRVSHRCQRVALDAGGVQKSLCTTRRGLHYFHFMILTMGSDPCGFSICKNTAATGLTCKS